MKVREIIFLIYLNPLSAGTILLRLSLTSMYKNYPRTEIIIIFLMVVDP